MSLSQLITPDIPVLSPTDTGNTAMDMMEQNNVAELPLVDHDQYLALAKENDLLDWNTPESELSKADFLNYKPAIGAMAHPFEAVRLINEMDLSVLPVTDNEHKYIGSITRDSILKYIAENSGMSAPGGIIVLTVPPRNYTLYEIARICENEDVVIMNLQVRTDAEGMFEVTLKLNRTELEPVVSSFERHNYQVKEVYGSITHDEDIENKYRLLMNYINM